MTEQYAKALAYLRSFATPLPVGAPASGLCSEDAAVRAIVAAVEACAKVAEGWRFSDYTADILAADPGEAPTSICRRSIAKAIRALSTNDTQPRDERGL